MKRLDINDSKKCVEVYSKGNEKDAPEGPHRVSTGRPGSDLYERRYHAIDLTRAHLQRAKLLTTGNSRLGIIQPRVLEEELTIDWTTPQRIIPVRFWNRVGVDNSAAHVYSVKFKVHEQQRDNEFDIESRESRADASRPP
jgi:hypothetical protein